MPKSDGQPDGTRRRTEGRRGEETRDRQQIDAREFRDTPDPIRPERIAYREGTHRLEEGPAA
jgi:hypothetical protein